MQLEKYMHTFLASGLLPAIARTGHSLRLGVTLCVLRNGSHSLPYLSHIVKSTRISWPDMFVIMEEEMDL